MEKFERTKHMRNHRAIQSQQGPNGVHKGDCLELLRALPANHVALTLTSPPYCMGKAYDQSTDIESFVNLHQHIIPEIIRVTKDGGSICWQVGYHVQKQCLTPLDFVVHQIFSQYGSVKLRNRIVWRFGHGVHCHRRFSGRHETVLWYTKGDQFEFNLDAVRIPQKYPGKKFYKGPNKGNYSGNPLGKNPSDVWDIPNVKANHPEKTKHPCQFPIALATRLIRALTNKGDLVFDPFTGAGTTGAAAILEKRKFLGAEIADLYCSIARMRIDQASAGALKFRPLEMEILLPERAGSVAKRPNHFRWNGSADDHGI